MPTYFVVILLLVGFFAGTLSGLVGVGGGIIIVPSLVFFLGLSQKQAQGTSLGILLLPVGIFGVYEYYKNGFIDIKVVLIVSAAFLAGALIGSRFAAVLPDSLLKKFFALLMLVTSIKMLFIDKPVKEEPQKKVSSYKQTNNNNKQ